DALLDSINDQDETPTENKASTDDIDESDNSLDESNEVADPDDIDALLDSINAQDETPTENKASTDEIDESDVSLDDANEITESESTESENTELINNFTDEYVQSFIDTDLSDVSDENATESLDTDNADDVSNKVAEQEQRAEQISKESETLENNAKSDSADNSEDISDDFDIDALIEEVNHSSEAESEDALEIGDDVLDTELSDSDLQSKESESELADQDAAAIDEETLAALSGDFDESTLTNLLNDEKDSNDMVELSPDFTDSNVLADLLADDETPAQANDRKSEASNVEEVKGIKELDNLDFDDLLANIEEESGQSSSDEFEYSEGFDIGDDFELDVSEDVTLEDNDSNKENKEEDFISVDSLLSDSLLDGKPTEPYEKMNIDVGLSEFPEFSGNITEEDVDDDDNGIAAKLDLAKVYLEIGDQDNAEVILLDVIKQGDAQQQFDAQQLLDNLKD
ncbi:MAG: pilus assembly protein FimV, partial [Cognaticolwellia sp.]